MWTLRSPASAKRWRPTFLVAFLGLLVPLSVHMISFWPPADLPEIAVGSDAAISELHTLEAAQGTQLLGPYSRFHFNHPGPAYFYTMVPLYLLFAQNHASFVLGAILLNTLAILLILMIMQRLSGQVLGAAVILSCYVAYIGPHLHFAWNPNVTILSFGVSLFSLTAVATGRISYLPLAVLFGSFTVQSHLGSSVVMVLVGTSALILGTLPKLRSYLVPGQEPEQVRSGYLLASLLLAVILWTPPLIEQVISEEGNLSKIIAFLLLDHDGHGLIKALRVTSGELSSFLLAVFGFSWDSPVSSVSLLHLLSGFQITLLVVAYRVYRDQKASFGAALCLMCMVGIVGALYSVMHVVGPIHDYLVRWISFLGCATSIAIVGVMEHWANRFPLIWRRTAIVSALGLLGYLCLTNTMWAWRPSELQEWARAPGYRRINYLAEEASEALDKMQMRTPLIQIASPDIWPTAAALVLQLHKTDVELCVADEWLYMFGRGMACSGENAPIMIISNSTLGKRLGQDHRFLHIAGNDEVSIHVVSTLPATSEIDFSSLDSLIYLRKGFAVIPQYEPGQGRWSQGLSSSLLLPLVPQRDYFLIINARPLPLPDQSQKMRVFLNGHFVHELVLESNEFENYVLALPSANVGAVNEILFEYAYAEPPMKYYDSEEWRPLGVLLRKITISPASELF